MYTAKSVIDNQIYSANQFQQMSDFEREQFRGKLKCESCNGDAYFRRKRKDGRRPCFCAKHEENCDSKSHEHSNDKDDILEPQEVLNSRDDQFRFKEQNYLKNFWADDSQDNDETDEDFENKGKQTRTHVINPSKSIITNIALPKILQICIKGLKDREDFEVEISENRYEHIRNCTYELKNVPRNRMGKHGFYWAYIINAQKQWLNSNVDYKNHPSFVLNDTVADDFWKFIRLKPSQWDKPVPVIVKGQIRMSPQSKVYVEVLNLESIYVHKRDFKSAFREIIKNNK